MSLCTCDPEKEYDLECFVHRSSNKQRLRIIELEKKLAVAVKALGRAKNFAAIVSDWGELFPEGIELEKSIWIQPFELAQEFQEALSKIGDNRK
jgi:hypothetical protein